MATTVQLTATATLSDDTTSDVTATAVWTTSAPTVATVSAAGLATAVAAGTATITATYGGQSATSVITVAATTGTGTVKSLAITPSTSALDIPAVA
jgi:uncharacterized protein YjdB